jgi:hypothetical protein
VRVHRPDGTEFSTLVISEDRDNGLICTSFGTFQHKKWIIDPRYRLSAPTEKGTP